MEKVIVIVGTNASGKSGLAISLAKKYNGEVISADSRQVYRDLNIATGKVTETEQDGVPHYLIDVADPTETYTAAQFAQDGRAALEGILQRDKVPIIAGGTGFYIDALLNPSLLAAVPPNQDLRAALDAKSAEELFMQLEDLDPQRAADLAAKGEDTLKRRLIRAIEVALTAPEHHTPQTNTEEYDILWIGLQWDNDILKQRIHERTVQRMEDGMVAEAQELHAQGLSWERMEELGLEYKHLADLIRGYITETELIERIERDDWRYAKRQRTWFKRNPDIHWIDGNNPSDAFPLVEAFLR